MTSRPGTSLVPVLAAVALVLTGCGSVEPGNNDAGASSGAATAPDREAEGAPEVSCAPDSAAVSAAAAIGKADVDGDGTADRVRATGPGGTCGDLLVANVGDRLLTSPLPDGPPVTGAYAVDLPGRDGQLLVTRADHPRGGYQLRVYAADADDLVELRPEGQPLVPFLATDVEENPFSVDCAPDGLVLTRAVAHEPVGVIPAWDVQRTVYTVDGSSVTAGPTREIADNVLPAQLSRRYPALVAHSAFADCRA